MNLEFLLHAAKAYTSKGEKEASLGMPTASTSFRKAAELYKKAVQTDQNRSEECLALAKDCEEKATLADKMQKSRKANPSIGARESEKSHIAPPLMGVPAPPKPKQPPIVTPLTGVQSEDFTPIEQLNSLVGLNTVKEEIMKHVSIHKTAKELKASGHPLAPSPSLCFAFTGNAGAGKTLVARYLGEIFKMLGILEKGHLVETYRGDLVSAYVGQTALKARTVIESALDGVLFIDEAYTLDMGANDYFGHEAIDELLKCMEDFKDRLVVVIAGYDDYIKEFIDKNPDLKARFNTIIEFEDYTLDELFNIFKGICKKQQYVVDPRGESMLFDYFKILYDTRDRHFGNARTVRNTFQNILQCQMNRIDKMMSKAGSAITAEVLTKITVEDVAAAIGETIDAVSLE